MKRLLLMLAIVLTAGAYSSSAQVYVNVRPDRPHYERVAAPSPRHVWIDEDWAPRGNSYAFTGGHWAEPPRGGQVWVSGRWRHSPRGNVWVSGRWR